jgi:phage terminase large subunit
MAETVSQKQCDAALRQMSAHVARWRRDPVAYAVEVCRMHPTDQQADILRALAEQRRVAVRSGHGIGKTRLLALAINWFLDTMYEPGGQAVKVPCTGPSGGNLSDVLWSEVSTVMDSKHEWFRRQFEQLSETLYYKNNPKLIFSVLRTARRENPDSLQGFHGKTLFVIDEASGVPDEIFELARGAMTDEHSYAIMAGNPTQTSGYFAKAFKNPRSGWTCFHVPSNITLTTENYQYRYEDALGNIQVCDVRGRATPVAIQAFKEEFGENSNAFRVRVLGEFGILGRDRVIEPSDVAMAWAGERPSISAETPRVMAVDVAYTGDDDTAFVIRHGPVIEHIETWHGADTVETTSRVMATLNDYKVMGKPIARVCVDPIGVGAGVYDQLRARGVAATPVAVWDKAPEDGGAECKKLRDWLWWRGRTFFKSRMGVHLCGPKDSQLWQKFAEELTGPSYTYKDGKIVVETKDEMKKRALRSPNIADAFLMTLYYGWDDASMRRNTDRKRDAAKLKRRQSQRNWKTV